MTWNYRVVEIQSVTEPEAPPYFGFITAWYSRSGVLDSWSAPPAAPYGSSIDELMGDVVCFKRAFDRDLLSNSTFNVEFGPPCKDVPDLVIQRTTYPKRENTPADEPAEEDFKFTVINNSGVEEPFVPTADSIHLLRRIIERMEMVINLQQAANHSELSKLFMS